MSAAIPATIPATMPALMKTALGPGNVELREVPVPEIGDEDVLLEVSLCGICGSDLHIYDGVHDVYPPVIMGHEYTGVAAKVGRNVTHLREGDLTSFYRSPGPFPGYRVDGAFARYVKLPAATLWKTPDGISPEQATQFETIRVPIDLVRDTARVQPGQRVVVSGPGHVGLLVVNMARLAGAGHITVLGGPGDEHLRLPKAIEMGADVAELMSEQALAKLAAPNEPCCWLECSGAAQAIEAAVEHIGYGGFIAVSGIGKGPWNVNMWKVARRNLTIRGRWGGKESYVEQSVPLMKSGELKMSATISAVMPMTQWEQAFDLLRRKQAIKILLDPSR
jgi:L-iditol 2-dehydrogenase